jgi:hypothetical protein
VCSALCKPVLQYCILSACACKAGATDSTIATIASRSAALSHIVVVLMVVYLRTALSDLQYTA